MTFTFQTERDRIYKMAEYAVTALVLIFGLNYLKQIVAMVLMELYKIFVQRGPVAI